MKRLGDLMTFSDIKALAPEMRDQVVNLVLDMPPDSLPALARLFDRVGSLDNATVDALSLRIASIRSMRSQLSDESYRDAMAAALASIPKHMPPDPRIVASRLSPEGGRIQQSRYEILIEMSKLDEKRDHNTAWPRVVSAKFDALLTRRNELREEWLRLGCASQL